VIKNIQRMMEKSNTKPLSWWESYEIIPC